MAISVRTAKFTSGGVELVGVVRRPSDARQHSALVLVTPGSSVKEQIGATYGQALAERGFLTLTFDPSFQGESGGEPRDLEDPAARMADVRSAVDYLQRLDDVNPGSSALLVSAQAVAMPCRLPRPTIGSGRWAPLSR